MIMRTNLSRAIVQRSRQHHTRLSWAAGRYWNSGGPNPPPGKGVANVVDTTTTLSTSTTNRASGVTISKRGDGGNNRRTPRSAPTTTTTTNPFNRKKEPQRPRILVVKRGDASQKNNSSEPPKVGVLSKRRKRGRWITSNNNNINTPREFKDRLEQPILVISSSSSSASEPAPQQQQRLPIINASALLSAKEYCIHSAKASTSKSGTEAAKRLLQGQHDFLQVVRQVVHSRRPHNNATKLLRRRSTSSGGHAVPTRDYYFCLQGHGVPQQLLQEHLQFASAVLCHYDNAAACSFRSSSSRGSYSSSTTTTDLMMTVESVRLRGPEGSSTRTWPPAAVPQSPYSWQESMELYLQVMIRMATLLGEVLVQPDDQGGSGYHHETVPPPSRWKADFQRGLFLRPQVIVPPPTTTTTSRSSENDEVVVPLVQWMPWYNSVRVLLQGVPTNGRAVTLAFDASFALSKTPTTTII